ncbi:hypothetical protein [Streptomyces sp. NPDC058741]|uniref:hypothetical protein n=1 Tax=unclassified Streptomyces TaxID=2593676 RepID=UPI0036B472D2
MTRTTLPEGAAATVEPVRERLLAAARARARTSLAEADEEAAAVLRDAEARAGEILAEARAQGEADAAAVLAAGRVRGRRAARARELLARRECWEELRRQVVRGVGQLAGPELRERLAEQVRRVLGPDARIVEAADGGVVGEAPGRRVDLSLTAIAHRTAGLTGEEVEELWAP